MQVKIKDQSFAGKVLDEILLDIHKEKVTVAELIQARVEQEIQKLAQERQAERGAYINKKEQKLNPKPSKEPNLPDFKVDIETETYRAWEAFQNNQFFILVNDRQVEDLQQEILLSAETTVSYIQLSPLVGG